MRRFPNFHHPSFKTTLAAKFLAENWQLTIKNSQTCSKNPDNAEVYIIERTSGNPVANSRHIYDLGTSEAFNTGVIHNNKLYTIGRYTDGFDFGNMRSSITKLKLSSLEQEWSILSHISPFMSARLYGIDIIVDNNSLITIHAGDDDGPSITSTTFFLQRTDTLGNVIWLNKYDIPDFMNEFVNEIINLPDGYLLYGRNYISPSDLFVLKTDKLGEIVWAKKINYNFNDNFNTVATSQSKCIRFGDYLYFVAFTNDQNNSNSDILLFKMNMDGFINDSCQQIVTDLSVIKTNVPPYKYNIDLFETISTVSSVPVFYSPTQISILEKNLCECIQCFTEIEIQLLFCEGDSIQFGNSIYHNSGIVVDTVQVVLGCDTIFTYYLTELPLPTKTEAISFCVGAGVTINGTFYNMSGAVTVTVPSISGCDTIITYELKELPLPTKTEIISFCEGNGVTINGTFHDSSGIVIVTVPAVSGCDTVVTYELTELPLYQSFVTINLCEGDSVLLGGTYYNLPGIVEAFVPAQTGCDTLVIYEIVRITRPIKTENVEFCQGDSVFINGNWYYGPNIIQEIVSASTGCDTVLTYMLQFMPNPQPGIITVSCPQDISVILANALSPVGFIDPTVATNCICDLSPEVVQTSGLPSGSVFPAGNTTVCFEASDFCGNIASCCFSVKVEMPANDEACDVKVINCLRFELLDISLQQNGDKTYKMKLINNCSNALVYVVYQVPDGTVATAPVQNSTYVSPGTHSYKVNNPNYSPIYGIRFKELGGGISNGQSDIFVYTLSAQSDQVYINAVAKLYPSIYNEVHLNTFYCDPAHVWNRDNPLPVRSQLTVVPNPTNGEMQLIPEIFPEGEGTLRVFNPLGQIVFELEIKIVGYPIDIVLPKSLTEGVYFISVKHKDGYLGECKFILQQF